MLYAKIVLTIKQDETVSDSKMLLFRGDKNVDVEFTLKSRDYVLSESAYAQLILTRPYASTIFSDLFEINQNKVSIRITDDMIDGMDEKGAYTIQIRLFDDEQIARVTLPPCRDVIYIMEPIASENMVNLARVNYTTVGIGNDSIDDIFTDGLYNKSVWVNGDLITDTRLNKIENALYGLSSIVKDGPSDDILNTKFDNVEVNESESSDTGTALDFFAGGKKLKTVYITGGGSGGIEAPYISTTMSENLLVEVGANFNLSLDFMSPNPGKGTLKVTINDKDAFTTPISQGESTVTVPCNNLLKGENTVVVYVLDRVGRMSNSLVFYARYGSTELVSEFDSSLSYDYGSTVRYYFIPSALDTSLSLTFYMKIDGVLQNGVQCTSDVRGYFTFPNFISAGKHYCECWVEDGNGGKSNIDKFNLVILNNSVLVVVSNTDSVTLEEGNQLVLDYKVYKKNENNFITKTYINNELIATGTCGLTTTYYKSSSLQNGEYSIKVEVYDSTETTYDFVEWHVMITPSTYTMLTPVNSGSLFIASAKNRTNGDANRTTWTGYDQSNTPINATLYNFSFNSESGWMDDQLFITGNSYVEVPVKPLSDNARYGFTLDVEFLTKQIGVENAEVMSLWDDTNNCGIKITTEQLIMQSKEGHKCELYFSENEMVSAIFVIDRHEKLAKIYLNGVMCSAFMLSDYIADGVSYLEDFTVNSNLYLGKPGSSGYTTIKNLRIYELALSSSEILNNFISNEYDKSKQQALSNFQKGDELPTVTVYCDFSGLGKDDKKPCKIVYNSPDDVKYGKSFVLDHKESQLQYQGTSSMAYPIKNYRLNLRDENGDKWYYDFPGGQPECRFTLKADFMSSGHWQNTGFTKWVNDNLYNYKINDEKSMNPKKWFDINHGGSLNDTRECIYGFPCRLILVNDGSSPLNVGQNEPTPGNTKDMGIFNFNHDKDCAASIGLDQDNFPNCASFEIAANSDTSAGAFMSYDSVNPDGKTELEYLKDSFELRFPDSDDVSEEWGFFGTGEEGTGIKALIDWVDKCTDEEFIRDFEQHFNKQYTLRYFLMVMVCGMVDNLGKNLMLDTWDNKIFMPRFYDCDTICSYDNSGDIKFDVDIEMEQGYWNTSSSRLWTRVRDLMHDDLVVMYNDMRQNGLSYESLMSYFYDEQIAKIPQKYYNSEFDVKYAPFAKSYIGMAHGDGYEHLKRWLKKRMIFCDTLFDYAPSYNNDVLTIRANTTEEMTIEIETYTPLYQHVSWYNGQMDKKKIDGKISVSFSGTAMAATDQEVLIYGSSNIKKITGLQSMNPNQMLIGYATKINEIDASNCSILADINSDGANLSPHVYLNNVNLANCAELSGNLRLNNSQLIRNVDISGTAISGIQLPTSVRNLETLKLSEGISSLTLRDANLLSELNLPTNIEYLNLINVPKLKTLSSSSSSLDKLHTLIMENPTINPISNIVSKAPNLTHVRLIGLDISCSTSQMESLLNAKGVDSFGNEIPIAQAVSGKVRLSECSADIEQQFKSTFPLVEFTVTNYVSSFSVTFVDGDGNTLYTTQVVQNGEAVYVGDTPTKTSTEQYNYEWSGWDRSLKPIMSDCVIAAKFNAVLRYYTIRFINGITNEVVSEEVLGYGATINKPDKPSGTNVWIPSDSKVTGDLDFISKYIPYPEDISIFNFIGSTVQIKNQENLPTAIVLPFETPEGVTITTFNGQNTRSSTWFDKITDLYIPETITTLGTSAFLYMGMEEINLPKTVTRIDTSTRLFSQCPNLIKVNAPGITKVPAPTTSTAGMFYRCPKLKYVTFGSEEYPFTSWKEYNTSSTSSHHLYITNSTTLNYVNLVTKNGKQEDVDFGSADFTSIRNSDKMIFTKTPIEFHTDELGFTYEICNGTANVIGYTGSATELEIPTTVKGATVSSIDDEVFQDNSGLTKVIAPSITTVGNYCFSGCLGLTSIEIPEVTSLGYKCFYDCRSLTSIELPEATSLGNYCFDDCYSLTSIELPKATSLGNECFSSCRSLTSIVLPKVTKLGISCFTGCSALESVSLSEITSIPDYCFYKCSALEIISIPKATSLSSYCFFECFKLSSVILPEVTSMGMRAFYTCTGLTSVESPKVTTIDDDCFDGCRALTSIEIPEVTSLGEDCFAYCEALTSIELPKVTTLSSSCFYECKGLTSIELPEVTSLGSWCFFKCTSLTSIELPKVTTLNNQCFQECKSLTSIELPKATILNQQSFYRCTGLTSIKLPEVTSLGDQCFAGCTGLTSVEIPKVTSLAGGCFNTCTALTSIELPEAITLGGNYCFYNCSNLTSIKLPKATSLGYSCIQSCTSLTYIEIPEVTSLGDQCFSGCEALTSIELPKATTLSESCFHSCTSLTYIEIPEVTSLGDQCFYKCSSLTSIEFPKATTLSESCFQECTSLTSIELPEVTTLGDNCFYKCSSLTSIELPKAINSGYQGFFQCTSLTSIKLPEATTINYRSFYDCTGLTSIEIPKVTSLAYQCFYKCSSLTSIELSEVTSLDNNCFYDCTGLTSIKLPKATSLGGSCFIGCDKLASIELPEVTSLGGSCFQSCYGLTSIELPKAISLGSQCFYDCTGLTSIKLPKATSLGDSCFSGCNKLTSIELPEVTSLGSSCFNCKLLTVVTLGWVGRPITDSSGYSSISFISKLTNINIYVSDSGNPPTLEGIPWGATNATITYEQA